MIGSQSLESPVRSISHFGIFANIEGIFYGTEYHLFI